MSSQPGIVLEASVPDNVGDSIVGLLLSANFRIEMIYLKEE